MSGKILLGAGATAVAALVAATAYAGGGTMAMGPASKMLRPAFHGYYDGHTVTYLNTDVSSKAEAKAMHVNYSASIGKVKGLPEIYLVTGRAAHGQLAVFGSEPGEPSYSPLWSETLLSWKASAAPVVIKSDTQGRRAREAGQADGARRPRRAQLPDRQGRLLVDVSGATRSAHPFARESAVSTARLRSGRPRA